jgi:hypothetical protein
MGRMNIGEIETNEEGRGKDGRRKVKLTITFILVTSWASGSFVVR